MKLKLIAGMSVLLACTTGIAQAQTAGHLLVSTGWLHFMPRDSSGPLTMVSPVFMATENTGASVSTANSMGLSATYFFDEHLAAEAVIGSPPKFDLKGTGELSRLGKLGTVKQLSPTLLLKYYFFDDSAKLRPYVGIGGSRVWFKNARITNPTLEAVLGGPTSASAKSAWSMVWNTGVSYEVKERLVVSMSVSYLPVRTTATLNTRTDPNGPFRGLPVIHKANIKINPIVTYLNVGYLF